MKKPLSHSPESGFTLLETLMVVGLLSGIMILLTVFLQDYLRREHMRGVAEHLAVVHRAASESINTIEKFDALYTLAENNDNVIELSILAGNNPNRTVGYATIGGVSLERGRGAAFAPSPLINTSAVVGNNFSGFRDTLPVRASSYVTGIDGPADNSRRDARLTVLARIADDPGDDDDQRALEILVATIDRISERDLRAIMAETNANGGLVSAAMDDDPNCHPTLGCAITARSAYGNWYASMVNFADTAWGNRVNGRLATLADGGYLVSYNYINESVLAGDYLYRNAIPNSPRLNMMHTALDLGGNNILGADNIEIADPVNPGIGNVLTVNNGMHAQGSVLVGGAARITGDLIAEGPLNAGAVTLNPSYDTGTILPPGHGNILVSDEMRAGSMTTAGDLSVRGATGVPGDARLLNLTAARSSATTLDISDTLTVTGSQGVLAGALTNAQNIVVNDKLDAGQINAASVSAGSAGIVQGQMGGTLAVENRISVSKLSVTGNVTIDNLTKCAKGC